MQWVHDQTALSTLLLQSGFTLLYHLASYENFYTDSNQCFPLPYNSAQGQLQHSSCQPTLAIQYFHKKIAFQVSDLNDAPCAAAACRTWDEGYSSKCTLLGHTDDKTHPGNEGNQLRSYPASASKERYVCEHFLPIYETSSTLTCSWPWFHS